jgi:hypothetical protein
MYHQIPGERESETTTNSSLVKSEYGEETQSHANVHGWCSMFYEGHK